MQTLLMTKFYIPEFPLSFVKRQRLVDTLQEGLGQKLTIISAPAGFGKTTLLGQWISQTTSPVCWLSLDEHDNDFRIFLRYFIGGLHQLNREVGNSALMMLESTDYLNYDGIIANLVNDIQQISQDFSYILDDYHIIFDSQIQRTLLYILEHQPKQMHLIVAGRADPPWPLARFRVRGEIAEIRAQDMRFSLDETAAFLNDVMGLSLSTHNIAMLENRTEGWIAGLQMAALSMRDHRDKDSFIQAFAGSHRFIMDYLMEEVLDQQSHKIRRFSSQNLGT